MQSIEKVEIEEIKRNSLMENGKLILDACCGSILIAFGEEKAEVLRTCDIAGKYVRIN